MTASPQHTPVGSLVQTTDGQIYLVDRVTEHYVVHGRPVHGGYIRGHTRQITGDYRIVRRPAQVRLKTRPSMRAKHQARREGRTER